MGNQSLKTAFKGHLKNEVAEEMSFHMNAEFLFEQHLINIIYEKVKKEKIKVEFEIENCMRENNNQVNSHCEDINIKKMIAEIHQNITAGFSSPEANIEYLKEPSMLTFNQEFRPREVLHSLLSDRSYGVHDTSAKEVLHPLQSLRRAIQGV